MELKPVISSNIKAIGYDTSTKILHVEFNNNTLYEYKNVPQEIYDGLINTSSQGSYLAQHIKGVYLYRRVR
jgi:hypothetical protein